MIRIPVPDSPGQVLELTEDEYHQHCAERHTAFSCRPDGAHKSMQLHPDEAIRMFQDGAPYNRNRVSKPNPNVPPGGTYPDQLPR